MALAGARRPNRRAARLRSASLDSTCRRSYHEVPWAHETGDLSLARRATCGQRDWSCLPWLLASVVGWFGV
jgi:hypothetical protein